MRNSDRSPFSGRLSAVTSVLSKSHLHELFLQIPRVRSTQWVASETTFLKLPEGVIPWRWNSLTQTLNALLPLEGPLRAVWNPGQFSAGWDPQMQTKHKLLVLASAIFDELFWGYFKMLQKIQVRLDRLANWAENCPCHETFVGEERRRPHDVLHEDVPKRASWTALLGSLALQTSMWPTCLRCVLDVRAVPASLG